ncbi:MAG: arabinogalactan endo-1,4-beta-galactosidase [Patiriisocius sp.]|jgi:arabinogalactan endo-1,4-beta-galactosidase
MIINLFKKGVLILFFVFCASFVAAQEYMIGADLSFAKEAEEKGFTFKEDDKPKKVLQIFKDHGYNWIRLRLFHTPTDLPNSLAYTISLAKEAKERGYKFLLDYHYSDTWADPAKQFVPKAWQGKTQEQMEQLVFEYTKKTMEAFREANVYPDMVQIGNEISTGMLWPYGKLPENWDNFAALIKAGINGVYASIGTNILPKIMIHIDKGGDKEFTKYFFDKLHTYNIKFDVIGQSYYPWWHGSLLDLKECLNFTALEYKKDIVLVETAYNYSPAEYINTLAPFPETPEGQKDFLENVNDIILNIPNNKGKGIFWWEPAAPNKGFSHRTFFNNNGEVQPVISLFDKYTRH